MPPATRAKSAIDEAPKPKPARHCIVFLFTGSVSPSNSSDERMRKHVETPRRPRPTTAKPITAPVVNATSRPSLSVAFLLRRSTPAHADVVLRLPSVATIMPHQPAPADSVAPETNETEIDVAISDDSVA